MTIEDLVRQNTDVSEEGFSIHLDTVRDEWDREIRAAGRKPAYRRMADELARLYREQFGREFLFTERCMAFEIQFHTDAYMAVTVGGYPRHPSTLFFSRAALVSHCRSIEISKEDVKSLRQRLMFRYRFGIRPCYKKTDENPFKPIYGLK